MKRYEFSIILTGCGETPEEAWGGAVDAFCLDPGFVAETDITLVEEVAE